MKPLNLKETELKEEMKEKCLAKGQYIDEKAKEKFNMLCHLEDFEVQYWELLKENKILRKNAEHNDKVVDKVNWENMLLKKENKQLKDNWNKLKEYIKTEIPEDVFIDTEWFVSILDKMQELERGCNSNENN